MSKMVCIYCGKTPPPGSVPLGTPCTGCGKNLILKEIEVK